MRIAVSGAHGLVGSALIPALAADGRDVVRLVRGRSPAADAVSWDPERGTIDAARLDGVDAVVHLAGESIASGRWTDAKKRRIEDSRVQGTRLIAETVAKLSKKPVLVCASAVGFYGPRGDEELDEDSPAGEGFLAEVCRRWERAADPARDAGVRVVHARLGVILSAQGGALPKMLTPFKLFVGGRVGTGRQWMSWIALDDVVGALRHAVAAESLVGPANFTAPRPATNAEFTAALGRVLSRPTLFPAPAFALRLALGEMADGLLLTGQRVVPRRLLATGYAFQFTDLDAALRHVLGL